MQRNHMMHDIITGNRLFAGIEREDVEGILTCCGARTEKYPKGAVMLAEGSPVGEIGLVLLGAAQAVKTDPSGRRIVIAQLAPGALYGDVLAAGQGQTSPVTVEAMSEAEVLLLPYEPMLHRCAKACPRHDRLLRNLLYNISEKYFELHERINCIIRPSLREKILFYLESIAQKQNSRTFNVPFDRAAMADFLNAERSALSRELSAMKREGILDYYKNTFRLL